MRLSSLSYHADFFICVAFVIYFAVCASLAPWQVGAEWTAYAAVGFITWTLLEYLIHRWIYHHVPYFAKMHSAHHVEPKSPIGAPPIIGIIIIFGLFYVPFSSSSVVLANGRTSGVLLGYCAYHLLYHAAHYWSPEPTSWLYRARHYHALHHYHSEHFNFGITTSFWDRVFGSVAKPAQRRAV